MNRYPFCQTCHNKRWGISTRLPQPQACKGRPKYCRYGDVVPRELEGVIKRQPVKDGQKAILDAGTALEQTVTVAEVYGVTCRVRDEEGREWDTMCHNLTPKP